MKKARIEHSTRAFLLVIRHSSFVINYSTPPGTRCSCATEKLVEYYTGVFSMITMLLEIIYAYAARL